MIDCDPATGFGFGASPIVAHSVGSSSKKNFYFFEKIAIWRVGLKIDIGHQIEILVGRSWQINFRGPDYDDEI